MANLPFPGLKEMIESRQGIVLYRDTQVGGGFKSFTREVGSMAGAAM
jgi:hypothetical protein